ncbi:MAG: DUF1501 domain-containing protein [Pirellulaceae bacterium]
MFGNWEPDLAVAFGGADGSNAFGQDQDDASVVWKNPLAAKEPHFPAKAKSVIFLFMYGGPSHIDTFDYKPSMYGMDNKTIDVKTFGRGGHKNQGRIVEPRWKISNNMVSAASGSRIYSRIWASVLMTSPSFTA